LIKSLFIRSRIDVFKVGISQKNIQSLRTLMLNKMKQIVKQKSFLRYFFTFVAVVVG